MFKSQEKRFTSSKLQTTLAKFLDNLHFLRVRPFWNSALAKELIITHNNFLTQFRMSVLSFSTEDFDTPVWNTIRKADVAATTVEAIQTRFESLAGAVELHVLQLRGRNQKAQTTDQLVEDLKTLAVYLHQAPRLVRYAASGRAFRGLIARTANRFGTTASARVTQTVASNSIFQSGIVSAGRE